MTLLVKAGLLVTGNGEEIENGWLLARDGMIEQVGSGARAGRDGGDTAEGRGDPQRVIH